MKTKKTSTPLTELRTVMTRAMTAYSTVENWPAYVHENWPEHAAQHTPHEINLIRNALRNAHDELYRVEQLTGYEGKDND